MAQWWGSKDKNVVGPGVSYKVLQADLIRGSERERAAAIASFVLTDEDAHKLAGHEGFKYVGLDLRGRCGVVQYKNMDVALLFKREVVQVPVGPADPVPERVLKEPSDAWIQISLLGTDEVDRQKGIGERLRQAMAQVERLRDLWKSEQADRLMAESEVIKLKAAGEKLRTAEQEIALLKTNIRGAQEQIEGLKREVQQHKEAVVTTKKKMVEEMFPMFDTVWLAGVHRVGDQLYGILKKQMTDALSKIGVDLIEPTLGAMFDPTLHHAVHSDAFETGAREIGCITRINRVGWKLGPHVMAAAEVAVGVEKPSVNEDAAVAQEQ